MNELVLLVDDDPDIRTFLEVTLSLAGYETVSANNGAEGVQAAIDRQPGIVLMDLMMPVMDGLEAIRRIRADGRTSHLPIIVLTAKAQGQDKVEGLASGADDYVTKPFDPEELVARVQSTLRRVNEMRTVSPLTGLPGNQRIEQEIERRLSLDDEFALLYADLNNFKAYNDHYGFMRGDDVIRGFARVVTDVVGRHGSDDTFVGHIGGDDFVVLCDQHEAERLAGAVCRMFDEVAPSYYDPEDRARGTIEVADRQGNPQQYPVVSVSIGISTSEDRGFDHQSQPVAVATEMKSYAKERCTGLSNYAIDRRRE